MFLKDFTRTATPAAFTPVLPALPQASPLQGGLSAATLIETTQGWRPATALAIGSRVHTLDGGAAMVLGLERQQVHNLPAVSIPGGLADNCADLVLPTRQTLLLDTLSDPSLPDADFVLVPAEAFLVLPGCARAALNGTLITPRFADEEILWANSGSLLHCPALVPADSFFQTLPLPEAQGFLRRRAARLGLAA